MAHPTRARFGGSLLAGVALASVSFAYPLFTYVIQRAQDGGPRFSSDLTVAELIFVLQAATVHLLVASACWFMLMARPDSSSRPFARAALVSGLIVPVVTGTLLFLTGLGLSYFPQASILTGDAVFWFPNCFGVFGRIQNPAWILLLIEAMMGIGVVWLRRKRSGPAGIAVASI